MENEVREDAVKRIKVEGIVLTKGLLIFILFLLLLSWGGGGVCLGLWLNDENRDFEKLIEQKDKLIEIGMDKLAEDRERIKKYNDFLDLSARKETICAGYKSKESEEPEENE